MPSAKEILFKYWGFVSFREVQEEVVAAVAENNDVLALLPTGGGKSICFQVPALMKPGICIVVSPLIALMKDQVQALRKKDIKAALIYSGMNARDIDITLDNCVYGDYKFLYISPERIKTEIFAERVQKMNVNLIAVDEAHCISQWGYDFRPSYLEISRLRELVPDAPVIALTATATEMVKADIVEKLQLVSPGIFQKSFVRNNLSYSVFEEEDKERKLLEILKNVGGSAVVYVRNRKATQKIAQFLTQHQIRASWYHAGMSNADRDKTQELWIQNQVKVIVATNAFGMGIDKPDVRVVVHMDIPPNIEAYYQEAGRAGRDEKKAFAVLLYQKGEIKELLKRFEQSHPDIDFMKRVYQGLANYYKIAVGSGEFVSFDFLIEDFTNNYQLAPLETFYAIKKLEESGLIQLNESFYSPSRIFFRINNKQLYEFQVANEPYDLLIKAILRIVGGEVFSDFVTIKEKQVADLLGVPHQEVIKKLEGLHEKEIIIYDKIKDKPQLTFTTPRFDANTLPIDKKQLEKRRKIELDKLNRIIAYLENTQLCRTRQLTEYFGEVNYTDCGVCDTCLRKKKSSDEERFDRELYDRLLLIIEKQPISLEKMIDTMRQVKKEKVIAMTRNLLEDGKVAYNDAGNLYFVKK